MWHDAARRAGSSVLCTLPHRAASDAGVAPLVSRSCFTGHGPLQTDQENIYPDSEPDIIMSHIR